MTTESVKQSDNVFIMFPHLQQQQRNKHALKQEHVLTPVHN